MKKSELEARIVSELIRAQRSPDRKPDRLPDLPFQLPPQLPIGGNRYLPFSKEGLSDVAAYARVISENDGRIAKAFSRGQLAKIVGDAFGVAFAPVDMTLPDEEIQEQVSQSVRKSLLVELETGRHSDEVTFGCWVATGPGTDVLEIGPVLIEERTRWLDRTEAFGRISQRSASRVRRAWNKQALRKRKPSWDETQEDAVLRMVGDCQSVCTVKTKGLSSTVADEKAALAARLAFTGIALAWQTPSRALDRMGLLVDGPPHHRHSVSFSGARLNRTSSSFWGIQGQWVDGDWPSLWPNLSWMTSPLGEALREFVQPSDRPARPTVSNAIFLSLMWFHAACRERGPLLSIVKFAASMDCLAGGRETRGIKELVDARLGVRPGTPLLTNGRTTLEVVKEIYSDARSRTIHGSIADFDHDWAETRGLAEELAALCLKSSCDWAFDNPLSDDLAALRRSNAP